MPERPAHRGRLGADYRRAARRPHRPQSPRARFEQRAWFRPQPDRSVPACWPAWLWRMPAPNLDRGECRADRPVDRLPPMVDRTKRRRAFDRLGTLFGLLEQLIAERLLRAEMLHRERPELGFGARQFVEQHPAGGRIGSADLLHFAHDLRFGRLVGGCRNFFHRLRFRRSIGDTSRSRFQVVRLADHGRRNWQPAANISSALPTAVIVNLWIDENICECAQRGRGAVRPRGRVGRGY